jgi:predicted negative regulator of RcsB-dependent stress response
MDEKQVDRIIGWAVVLIVIAQVLQMIVPFLVLGVIGLVIWRVYQATQNRK